MADFIQGFLAEFSLDGNTYTTVVADVSLSRSKTVLEKSVMDGLGYARSIPGMTSGSVSISGHVSQAELNLLEVTFAKGVPVSFVFTITEGLTIDGVWLGDITISSFDVQTAADGNWAFTLAGDTVGEVVFTPSTP